MNNEKNHETGNEIRFVNAYASDAWIKPKRATRGSAGYDFFATETVVIPAKGDVVIDTGTKVKMPEGVFFAIYPRSGLGFKHRIQLANTVGVIDSDYYSEEPGKGVIKAKLYNPTDHDVVIEAGKAYCQGIFQPYLLTSDDDSDGISRNRNGDGFGSTDNVGE